MNDVHYSSKTVEWATPQNFFDLLNTAYCFDLDVCANAQNAKCARFFTPEDDGLSQAWCGVCWMNPPYGHGIGKWIRKAHESALAGATVVCLVPARTDTAWWHDYIKPFAVVDFVRGRLKFGGYKVNAPFPCAVVVFRPPA